MGAARAGKGLGMAFRRHGASLVQVTRLSFVNAYLVLEDDGATVVDTTLRGGAQARRTWEVGYDPRGVARQLMAIQASGDRTEALRRLDLATLVIHGDADPLVQLAGGEATAAAIPGARLEVVEGMGHDLPPELYGFFADRIEELARAADGVPAPD